MTLPDVNEFYGTDERCRQLLERLRWPEGVMCPRCKDTRVSRLKEYARFECVGCEYQFTATSGTIFHDSHLPLPIWFLAVLLLCEAKKSMSALQLKRTIWGLNKGSYKTAWYLCHRIRSAMSEVRTMMDGTVEIDETYIGGQHKGIGSGNYRDTKAVVIGIIQRGGDLKFIHCKNRPTEAIHKALKEHVSEDVDVIVTDESILYNSGIPASQQSKRQSVNHRAKEYVRYEDGFMVTTNTVESAFSLFKRGIVGSWHKVSPKHLAAYLNEMTFRFNRRKNPDLFIDTLRHMVTADPLTFEKLTA
jgi:transposase-like protein